MPPAPFFRCLRMYGKPLAQYKCNLLLTCQSTLGAGPNTVATGLVPDELIDFSLTPTTIEIGHNPITGQFLTGGISLLEVDPPAFGSGGG